MSDLLAFAVARRQARANLHLTWLDGGTLEIYSGTRPATPDTAITDQVLLCTFTLADPAGSATDGVFTGTLPDPALVLEDGDATWARAKDDQDGTVWDADVGTTGSGAVVELNSASLVAGGYVTLTAISVEE